MFRGHESAPFHDIGLRNRLTILVQNIEGVGKKSRVKWTAIRHRLALVSWRDVPPLCRAMTACQAEMGLRIGAPSRTHGVPFRDPECNISGNRREGATGYDFGINEKSEDRARIRGR